MGATAIGLLMLSNPSRAVSLCVSNATQLQQALSDATSMYSGTDVEINLVQGTYKTGSVTANGPFKYFSNSATGQLSLVGGWTAQCNSFEPNAALTLLDGNHSTQVLSIRNPDATISIEYLTIQNGETTAAGGGLSINPSGGGAGVFIGNNIIRNNHTTNSDGGLVVQAGGTDSQLDLLANVISGNSSDSIDAAGALGGDVGQVYVISNTVFGNTTTFPGGTGGLDCCGTGPSDPVIYFNIFFGNTNYGLYLNGTAADVEYNDYGTLGGVTPDHDVLNTGAQPKFVDSANGDLHLSSTSPLLAYAPANPPIASSTDVSGNSFPRSGKIDLGAYEDTVFTDSFDGN
jgi:hypothetical protein